MFCLCDIFGSTTSKNGCFRFVPQPSAKMATPLAEPDVVNAFDVVVSLGPNCLSAYRIAKAVRGHHMSLKNLNNNAAMLVQAVLARVFFFSRMCSLEQVIALCFS